MRNRIPADAYAMIIGAMKCGTTSLYSYLQGHPEICPAIKKEPEYFSENQGHGVQVSNYNDLWDFDDSVHKYALEASTGYTKYPSEQNIPKKIYSYGIKPKFIYIIRNPFDRMQSHFNFRQNKESRRLNILDKQIINTNNYFIQLEQYRRYFPREDILILDFDELRENPHLLLQRVYRFLGLMHSYFPDDYEVKNPTQFHSRFEKKLRSHKFGAFLGHAPMPLKKFGKDLLRKTTPCVTKRILTQAENEFVYNELIEDMANLHHVYGIDVSRWGFNI